MTEVRSRSNANIFVVDNSSFVAESIPARASLIDALSNLGSIKRAARTGGNNKSAPLGPEQKRRKDLLELVAMLPRMETEIGLSRAAFAALSSRGKEIQGELAAVSTGAKADTTSLHEHPTSNGKAALKRSARYFENALDSTAENSVSSENSTPNGDRTASQEIDGPQRKLLRETKDESSSVPAKSASSAQGVARNTGLSHEAIESEDAKHLVCAETDDEDGVVCPHELLGMCSDPGCRFLHLRT